LSWPKATLRDHVDLLTGFPFKSANFTTGTGGVRLLRGANIAPRGLDWNNVRRLPASIAERYGEYLLQEGDVVLAMDRPWIEAGLKFGYVSNEDVPALLVQRVSRMRGANGLLTSYLRYLVGSPEFTNYIAPIVTGVNVPHISPTQIKGFRFALPPLDIQRKIADILASYDDLIENNNRRIRILEEMAQRIYREWFVDFLYPGHESVPLVESELGPVPEGWRITKLADRLRVVLGGTPSRAVARYWSGGTVPWINSGRVNELRVLEGSELITPEALKHSNAKMMPRGTTVVAITGATLGQVSLLEIEACANQSVVGVYDPDGRLSEYVYLTIKERIERIIGAASGGAQQHINQKIVRDTVIPVPPPALAERFRVTVDPLFTLLGGLLRTQGRLRQARDLLLPRLISGEIDVARLNIAGAETVA
jgi:type I restriction enzyme S subunit